MYFLADNDILRLPAISQVPIITAFNYMAFRKDQAKKEKLAQEQLKNSYKIK
jgi:hypothetical protein